MHRKAGRQNCRVRLPGKVVLEHRGVVDDDVGRNFSRGQLAAKTPDLRRVGEIGGEDFGLGALLRKAFREVLRGLPRAMDMQQDAIIFPREKTREGNAEPAGRAGDQRCLHFAESEACQRARVRNSSMPAPRLSL